MKITPKRYRCKRCGHIVTQETNHFGPTWSFGHVNTCPACPPYAKYPEFGGHTEWECLDTPAAQSESTTSMMQDQIDNMSPEEFTAFRQTNGMGED